MTTSNPESAGISKTYVASTYLRGVSPANFTYGNIRSSGIWESGTVRVANLNESYLPMPIIVEPTSAIIEANTTHCFETFLNIKGGGEFPNEIPFLNRSITKTNTAYFIVKVKVPRIKFQIDPQQLIKIETFEEAIQNTMRNMSLSTIDQNKQIFNVFNSYGWFVPTNFTVGSVYTESFATVPESSQHEETIKNEMMANVKLSYDSVHGGKKPCECGWFKRMLHYIFPFWFHCHQKNEMEIIESIKASVGANGALDMENFVKQMDNENYWDIIEYDGYYPTILFLPIKLRCEIIKLFPSNAVLQYREFKYLDYVKKAMAEDPILPIN